MRHDDGEGQVTMVLECDGAGDDPACAEVVALLPRLTPAADEACTQIYAGPERYLITGTVDGAPVDLKVGRDNGCAIERYDLLAAALPG